MATFREKILFKMLSIEFRNGNNGIGTGMSNELFLNLVQSSGVSIKNVCCRLSAPEKASLDVITDILDMSVQEFVSEALKDAMASSIEVIESRGSISSYENLFVEKLKAENLRLVQSSTDKNQQNIEFIDSKGGV